MTVKDIAQVCYEVNRAYRESLGDTSQEKWEDAPGWLRESANNGVQAHLSGEGLTPKQSHDAWLKGKIDDGWSYGPIKGAEFKRHPYCVPYSKLPVEKRSKDHIFGAIVEALRKHVR